MPRWTVLVAMLVCLMPVARTVVAGDEAKPLPEWRQAANEIDAEGSFLKIYVNNIDTLWSEFSRSQLYRSFAQDPSIAANSTKMIEKMETRLKAFSKAVKQDDDLYLVSQLGKLGPFASGWSIQGGPDNIRGVIDIRHQCDPAFVTQLNRALSQAGTPSFARILDENYDFPETPFAHRLVAGQTVLNLRGSANVYSDARHFLFLAANDSEPALLKQLAVAGTPNPKEDAFAEFMGTRNRWMAAMAWDLPGMVKALSGAGEINVGDFRAIAGELAPLFAKEQVNKSNRFDLEMTYPGADLNKGLLFFGAGAPLNNDVAQVYPDELVLILHANYDFKKFLAVKPDEIAGTSTDFQQGIARMQKQMRKLVAPEGKDGKPGPQGPVLTNGFSLLLMEADRLEDLGDSFVMLFGIEPGFKINKEWVAELPSARDWEGNPNPTKTVTYSNTDIAVIGENSTECLAVVGGVLVAGPNLKQVKRVVRYLNKVQAGDIDPRKSNEWQHLTTLVQQDGHGSLHAFALLKMDFLMKTLVPTGIGAGAMLLPDLPTDVNWTAVAGRLQPATGVVMYDPAKGFKARMVSDLPLGSLAAIGGITSTAGVAMQDRSFFFRENDLDDLPPVGGKAMLPEGVDDGGLEMEEGNAAPAVEEPPAVVAPKVEDAQPAPGN